MKSTSHGIVDVAHEVGEEEHGALEDADEQRVLARVVARDLASPSSRTRCWSSSGWTRISPMAAGRARRQCRRGAQRGRGRLEAQDSRRATTARAPSPTSSAPSSERQDVVGAARRPRHGGAGRVLGQPAHDQARQRRRQRREAVDARSRRGRRGPSATTSSSTSASSRSSSAVRRRWPRPRGWTARSAGRSPSRTRARAKRVVVVASRPRASARPRARAVGRRLLPRARPAAAARAGPSRGGHAQQRAPRPGEAASR